MNEKLLQQQKHGSTFRRRLQETYRSSFPRGTAQIISIKPFLRVQSIERGGCVEFTDWSVSGNSVVLQNVFTHITGHVLNHKLGSSQHSIKLKRMKLQIQFSGGAELLFDKQKTHNVELSDKENWTIRSLIAWVKDNLLKERPELFVQGDSVRPGILVMVNMTDWALLGELDYQLQDGDEVLFISTLHGG